MDKHPQNKSKGFTIVELMIATAVFSLVLLLVTVGIVQFTQVYYKGITEGNTQNTARTIIETISQAIQFSGGTVTLTPTNPSQDTSYSFCVGTQQFTYRLGWQVENFTDTTNKQTWHSLVQTSGTGSCGSTAPDLTQESISGRDLVGEHMRLSNIIVKLVGTNMYWVDVKVAYGDKDLLNNATGTDASCLGVHNGSAFCAVSELSTTVVKRVQ